MDVLVFLAWCVIKPLYLWLEGSKRKARCCAKMVGNRDTTSHPEDLNPQLDCYRNLKPSFLKCA